MSKKTSTIDKYKSLTYEFPDIDGESMLRELMLYIADICFDDRHFGATKLNKILYYSDFESFRRHGKPITGIKYQRLDEGPAPKRLVPIRDKMIENGELFIKSILSQSKRSSLNLTSGISTQRQIAPSRM